jgi:hypothetical protein
MIRTGFTVENEGKRDTLILVKSDSDLHVETEWGIDGCGRCGRLSNEATCGEATCETVSFGNLAEGMPTHSCDSNFVKE